jgi:hypothetical protein
MFFLCEEGRVDGTENRIIIATNNPDELDRPRAIYHKIFGGNFGGNKNFSILYVVRLQIDKHSLLVTPPHHF